jgi:hypothetical protein
METYQEFLAKKIVRAQDVGFDVDATDVNPMLFGFQRDIPILRVARSGRGRDPPNAPAGCGRLRPHGPPNDADRDLRLP